MRFLLDTHALLWFSEANPQLPHAVRIIIEDRNNACYISHVSAWEIAIKIRLGKLEPGLAIDHLPKAIGAMGLSILPITATHSLAEVEPVPPTRDPFDRLLLAQCIVENRRLATVDHALTGHPFAAAFHGRP